MPPFPKFTPNEIKFGERGNSPDTEGIVNFLTSDAALELKDRMEDVSANQLDKLVQEKTSLNEFFQLIGADVLNPVRKFQRRVAREKVDDRFGVGKVTLVVVKAALGSTLCGQFVG